MSHRLGPTRVTRRDQRHADPYLSSAPIRLEKALARMESAAGLAHE